ncbi:uncharacterized protein LOC132631015 [Lycium barbarum]|uniref:uncharacterized protein LOC132631015 n=1 Tax=Lycium barbarum TaxID=112863 RepID=UPI00293E0FFF|nr:uncharacterized protein LOC132631015 [Lycium barbarum]
MVLEARDSIEQEIWWETHNGTAKFWYDNWTKLRALHYVVPDDFIIDDSVEDVSHFITEEGWNEDLLHHYLPEEIVNHVVKELKVHIEEGQWDKPWWMMISTGKFTVSSAWELLRQRANYSQVYKQMWIKGVPFKINFLLWRMWKFKIPVHEVFQSIETIDHLFLNRELARKVWKFFTDAARISMIWKWRNTTKHGGTLSLYRVLHEIQENIHRFCSVKFPAWQDIPHKWPDIVKYVERFEPCITCVVVRYDFPSAGWFKLNTDCVAKGNLGPSSAAFCMRNDSSDLIYAEGKKLTDDGSSLIAKAVALRNGVAYCESHNLWPLIVETDSLSMKNFISNEWEVPWSIILIIKEINRMGRNQTTQIQYIFREGNAVADFLTNLAFDFAGTVQFHNLQELPSAARKLINMDKAQVPNLRIRYTRDRRT